MKAVMKIAPGEGNVALRDIAEPHPNPKQVVIEVSAAGICGTDIHIFYDEFKTTPPVVLGHEVAGRVVQLGSEVDGVELGSRVDSSMR